MSDYRELLLGCGHARDKRICAPGTGPQWRGLVTLDRNENVGADCTGDLDEYFWAVSPFKYPMTRGVTDGVLSNDYWDEVHAYEVLEHLGQQGNAAAFFATFNEIWRILKPGGYLCATVPSRFSPWLWGDPSHRRAILPESLVFLDRTEYIRQLDGATKTPMSDFRDIFHGDFRVVTQADNRTTFAFILQAVKPARETL